MFYLVMIVCFFMVNVWGECFLYYFGFGGSFELLEVFCRRNLKDGGFEFRVGYKI